MELSEHADAIWKFLYPYIVSKDGPNYDEEAMEDLCAGVLPNVWDHVSKLETALRDAEVEIAGFQQDLANPAIAVMVSRITDLEKRKAKLREIIQEATIESAEEFIIISLTHEEYKALTEPANENQIQTT